MNCIRHVNVVLKSDTSVNYVVFHHYRIFFIRFPHFSICTYPDPVMDPVSLVRYLILLLFSVSSVYLIIKSVSE